MGELEPGTGVESGRVKDATTLEECEAALAEAQVALRAVEARIGEEKRAAAAKIDAAHRERLAEAQAAVNVANAALRSANDQAPDHPWTGRRVYRMVRRGRSWERLPDKREEGVVETMRSFTRLPDNTASYRRPGVGKPFVRLLKANGEPGTRFETFGAAYNPWKLVEPAPHGGAGVPVHSEQSPSEQAEKQ